MRESRTYGSVRGALSNERPYRYRFARNDGGDCAALHPGYDTSIIVSSPEASWFETPRKGAAPHHEGLI